MRRLTLIAAVAVAATASSAANERSQQRYAIAATLTDNGRVVAKPLLLTEQDQPTRIEISDKPDQRYSVTVKVQPLSSGRLSLSMVVDVTSPTSGKLNASPVLEVAPGATAAIELGKDSPEVRPFRLEVQVTPATD